MALELDGGERRGEVGGRDARAPERRPEREVLARREVLVDVGAVGHQAQVPPHGLGLADGVVPGHHDPPAGRAQERRQDLEQRRLARAVGAEQRDGLAARHVEGDAVQRPVGAERLAEVGDADEGVGGHQWNRLIVP